MPIRYSVIIPTFNRVQQLLLTLVSFETQTFPKDQFEVIVADDGSTDGTKGMVSGYQASYPLRYVSHEQQRGRSAIRNLGIRHARGIYTIFCDADFLVLPEFIRTFSRYHRKYPHSVISGIPHSWDDAYTHYYPEFSPEEQEHCRSVLVPSGMWNPDFEAATEIIPLLSPEDLLHRTDALSKVISPSRVPPHIKAQFAATDVAPWMLLVTRCVSVKRSLLKRIGGFNERFVLYGLEDWDLGFRLHRLKVPFRAIKEVVGYHQEHPTAYRGNTLNPENVKIMFDAYGFRDASINLLAVLPPSEDLEGYKYTLRILRRGLRSKLTRNSALLLIQTLRLAARQYYLQRNSEGYKASLRRIRKKTQHRKSEVARILQVILDRSEKLAK